MGRNADDLGAVFGIWGKETAVDNFVLSGPGFHVDEGGLVTLLEPSRDVIVAREVLFLDRSDFLQLLAAFPQLQQELASLGEERLRTSELILENIEDADVLSII